jgi:hypothetical protein
MTALCNRMARNAYVDIPADLLWPRAPTTTTLSDNDKKPRCRLTVRAPAGNATGIVDIWCLDDLMTSNVVHGRSDNKSDALNIVADYGKATYGGDGAPDGVVAFGTAGYPDDTSYNGCATVGSTIFIRDAAMDGGPDHSNWSWANNMGVLVRSKTPATFFSSVDPQTVLKINSQMLGVPVNPSSKPRLVIASDAVAISSVNIPRGTEFGPVDLKAMAAARAAGASNIASVETTHGVIRAKWSDAPFIFVTAIPNRVGHFSDEAGGNYPQELASTHNAGVALSGVIPFFIGAIA